MGPERIKIGTLIRAESCREDTDWAAGAGFESVQIFGKTPFLTDLEGHEFPVPVSCLGLYGDIVHDDWFASEFSNLIRYAYGSGVKVVSSFTGAFHDRSVLDQVEEVASLWDPLVALASELGVKIAFEQCAQGGLWENPQRNLVHSLRGWDLFSAHFPAGSVFLEWEPGHQVLQFANPLAQLDRLVPQIAHIHGKDAEINREALERWGNQAGVRVTHFRLPSRGQTDWIEVFRALDRAGWTGSVDVEGFHDPAYAGDMEREGQILAMKYLKECRAIALS
jgi:sugar phosphate isomerase/epimerase